MLGFNFNKERESVYRLLCLGAHSDDIEIGCGGTILRLIEEYPNLSVYWIVFGSNDLRTQEAIESANSLLYGVQEKKIVVQRYRDSFFPFIGGEIKDCFEHIKKDISPDIIFTHYRDDLHQDHRLISDLTWNTFRDHLILEYEVPKYDGDLGSPNFFVYLNKAICERKIQHILTYFKTQGERHWFTDDTFLSLLRLRGVESKSSSKYAEAFYCRKLVY